MRDIIQTLKQIEESQTEPAGPQVGDEFGLSFSEDLEISTTITDVLEDGIVVEMDDNAITHMTENGVHFYEGEIVDEELDETEAQKGVDGKRCWKGYKRMGTKMKGGKRVDNCVKVGEGIEEAVPIDKPADRDNPWYKLALLLSEEGEKIPLKTDEGIKLSDDVLKLAGMMNQDQIQSQKAMVAFIKQSSDPKALGEIVNKTIREFKAGREMDRTRVKEPADSDAYQGMESTNELDRIKSLSGVQTEGHGPEVDGFLEKLASMDDDQEKYETAEKAYAGKFGPKIQQAIHDMYNEAKKSVGDMDDIMDDVLDMIEKDYGPKEDVGVDEAEYQGRKVSLGKPTRGDVKKFKVYVKNPKGNVVKVNFGDPNMKIKKSNPARRKSFRARHNCDNPGPRHKARYWSCRKW